MDPVDLPASPILGPTLLWTLSLLAFGIFGRRAWQLVGLVRRGRPENRLDHPARRVRHFLHHVLLQPRIFNERAIGLPHFLIFWGFVIYAACFGWALLRGLFPALPVPYPDEFPPAALFLDLFAVLVLAGIVAAVARRLLFPPPHLHLSADANVILALIGALMLTTLLGAALRTVAGDARAPGWTPFGTMLAAPLAPLPHGVARAGATMMWWTHMIVVLGFLVYLPYSKHLHLLASPINVLFSNAPVRSPGDLSFDGAPEEMAAGASRWEELTWKQLLGGFSCAECGRCDRACPAAGSGAPLLPQQLVQKIKEAMLHPHAPDGSPRKLIGDLISETELWACTTCLACMERCAVWNEQVPLVVALRRHLVSEGRLDRQLQEVLSHLSRYGNSFGKSDRLRARWTQNRGLPIKDARREPVDLLWFVGDTASFDPRCEGATRNTARILAAAGIDFGLLHEAERNAGNDARRIGEEGLFEMLRDKNIAALAKARFDRIFTTDPHTYNTLRHEYPWPDTGDGGASPPTILHSVELFAALLDEGRLTLARRLSGRVTFHDPCYLGRYNGIYDPPRRILARLGLDLREMPRHGARSHCCGAGGGRIWMEDDPGVTERPALSRVREAASLDGVATLVVACPKDVAMFDDAIRSAGLERRLEVRDIADLVWRAVAPDAAAGETGEDPPP